MDQRHCPRCGGFLTTCTPEPSLFDTHLPFPSVDDRFAAFHRESQRREASARKRGVTRQIGAERRARSAFTHQALWGVQ